MRRIAIINQKGGVGKTTSCCNVGAALAATGKKCLLIDLDPQANLTMHLGFEPDSDRPSIYDVLTDNVPIADAAVEARENLTLVCSHIDLAAAEMELVSVMGREVILRDALRAHGDAYDYILIDCPPSLGVLTINGLAAMNEVFVPMQPHFLALQGVGKLLETIRLVKDRINGELSLTGIILCMYEAGTRLAGEVSADLAAFLDESRGTDAPWANAKVFDTIIRRNIKLAECPSHGMTIAEYAPRSNGAIDYASLTAEVLGVDAEVVFAATPAKRPVAAAGADEAITEAEPPAEEVAEVTSPDQEPEVVAEASEPPADTTPVFDAGDRVALGPDDVTESGTPEPAEAIAEVDEVVEEVAATSEPAIEEEHEAPAPIEAAEPVQPAPTPAPAHASPAPVKRSIPIVYEEEPATSGARRD
ncbi:MAG: AAA family ATPase [Phycisphaerales bacterium]|nr:AAA family ATPase [Phycisphaerales bacterium]